MLAAEGDVTPYDAGVRHIATLAGYLSYGLMALTVRFGVLTTTGWARRGVRRATLYGGHMTLALVTLTFGCLHAVAYVFQTGEHFSYLNAVVPLAGGGEPEVALGIVGLELGLAVAASIWLQRRLGYRRWHVLHYLAYVAFGLSLAHVIATSHDVQALGMLGLAVFALAAACALMAHPDSPAPVERRPGHPPLRAATQPYGARLPGDAGCDVAGRGVPGINPENCAATRPAKLGYHP